MYSIRAEGLDEQQLEALDASIGMIEDPGQVALADLRAHQEVMGMTFSDPDAPVAVADDERVPAWMTADEDLR